MWSCAVSQNSSATIAVLRLAVNYCSIARSPCDSTAFLLILGQKPQVYLKIKLQHIGRQSATAAVMVFTYSGDGPSTQENAHRKKNKIEVTRKKSTQRAQRPPSRQLITPLYGIVPCIIAELSWKFHQNPLIKRISTDNCWKTLFPQQNVWL